MLFKNASLKLVLTVPNGSAVGHYIIINGPKKRFMVAIVVNVHFLDIINFAAIGKNGNKIVKHYLGVIFQIIAYSKIS